MTNHLFEQHTVLLVDDEASSRALVGQMLRRLGFRDVLLAEDGYTAIEILNATDVTAVITDFRMPGLHGLQLLKYIRTGQTYAPRNLICGMLTSYAERDLVGLAIVLDVDTFLAKPVSMETITKHLKRSLAYRFEPLPAETYLAVDVDNAAPHLTAAPFDLPKAPARAATPAPSAQAPIPPPPPLPTAAPIPTLVTKTASRTPEAATPSPPAAKKTITPTDITADHGTPAKRVALDEVPEDAVLARDLYGAGGTLLLAAGTRFKSRYIRRLEELRDLKEKIEHVWIVDE